MDDLDCSNFTAVVERKFNTTYGDFIFERSIDSVSVGHKRMMRGQARDFVKDPKYASTLEKIRANPKQVEINNLSVHIEEPHALLGFDEYTSIQRLVLKHIPYFPYYGSFAYSCSCGSGKTVAGLQIIAGLQCRTMIISSRNAVNDQWKCIIEQIYPELIIETKGKQSYGGIKIPPKKKVPLADIYIDTPQYLAKKIETLQIKPSLIIFDEVHSLLSSQYIKVLLYPLVKVLNEEWTEIPYMVALSATYPPMNDSGYKSLMKIFGKAFRTESNITKMPVYVYDYYDHYRRTKKDKETGKIEVLMGEKARGRWDQSYNAMDDYDVVEYFADAIDGMNEQINDEIREAAMKRKEEEAKEEKEKKETNEATKDENDKKEESVDENNDESKTCSHDDNDDENEKNTTVDENKARTDDNDNVNNEHKPITSSLSPLEQITTIDPSDASHKGLIMTYTVDSSVYAAIYCHMRWNVSVLIIRSVDEVDVFIPKDEFLDFETLSSDITFDYILQNKIGYFGNYMNYVNNASIICGTFHRLKEGFSVQNITWGICTKFVWSYMSRVQLVGRIRRTSNDPELNSHTRILLAAAGVRTSNVKVPNRKAPERWLYDMDIEESLFEYENYIRI